MKIARVKVAVGAKFKAKSMVKTVRAPKIKTKKIAKVGKKKGADVEHPPYVVMIKNAINELIRIKDGKARFSKTTILDHIHAHYNLKGNLNQINSHLRAALKRGVSTGMLIHTKGTGVNGSFKLAGEYRIRRTGRPAPPSRVIRRYVM